MRFPLRRNANVLDTLLTETLQILVVFSIMGWPFSGMQQCETKGMSAERVQNQQLSKQQKLQQQQQHLELHYLHHQQHHYPQQQQQQMHKLAPHTLQQHNIQTIGGEPSPGLAYRHDKVELMTTTVSSARTSPQTASSSMASPSWSSYSSASSSSSPSSLDTHDMHFATPIITKNYQHNRAPTGAADGDAAYTQPITTITLTANEATARATATVPLMSVSAATGVGVEPTDMRIYPARASTWALHALHRVSKDTQHNGVYAQLPPVNSDSANDSQEIDNMDYVMSEHIASLTHTTGDDGAASVSASAAPRLTAHANSNKNHSNNSNSNNSNSRSGNMNINANNSSSSNNQMRDDLRSLSLLSVSDHNMEISAMAQEMAVDASLTSSSSAAAAAAASPSSASLSSSSLLSESASLTAADRTASDASVADESANTITNNNNNMQHLGTQRIALTTTAKTKTTLATEHQHNAAKSQAITTAATGGAAGRQRGSAKKVESKYILPKPQKTDAPMLNYIFDTFSTANKHHHHDQRYGPHFEDVQRVGQPTNMTVQAGSSIHFNCRISLLQDKTVSWVRRNAQGENALDLLTVGLHTYTGDKRYKMEFQYPNNWRLKITNVKKDDEAMYECQISTHPPRVIQINLFVNAPKVMIVDEFGDPLQEKYYEIDSTLQLSCVVRNVAMATSVVYWKHGVDVLNYDVTRGGISVKTELMDDGANSTLSIAKINKSDSGNYTCAISDFQNFSIVVHILNGESFAELHHGAAAPTVPSAFHQQLVVHCALLSLLLLLLLLRAPHQPYTLVHR
ncbi:dual specificity protein kinase splA [Bactrocera tryoni]|uniref:dual specificity protein kinase splA n=1 Tax=Bactrocera tryoni TaxID=59916 RepID=UPI001A986EAA|nr:dual specificity protein kinase splA [Bactrocera tryoni]